MVNKTGGKSPEKEGAKRGLSVRKVNAYLRFVLFLTLIGMGYIANTHYAVEQVRKAEGLRKEVKDLRSKYLMRESTLRAGLRFSEVADRVDTLGLHRLTAPPYRLPVGGEAPQAPVPPVNLAIVE